MQLWLFAVTDDITGKRRQTCDRMMEAEAFERFGADAVKVKGTLENPTLPGLDKKLKAVAAEVLAGRYVETPLELIRVVHLVGCSDEDVFRALSELCPRHGLAFTVHEHRVGLTTARFIVFRVAP